MPVTKTATRALSYSTRRKKINYRVRQAYKKAVQAARQNPELISKAYAELDKASKKGVIHAHKAARLKARVSKVVQPAPAPTKSRSRLRKAAG